MWTCMLIRRSRTKEGVGLWQMVNLIIWSGLTACLASRSQPEHVAQGASLYSMQDRYFSLDVCLFVLQAIASQEACWVLMTVNCLHQPLVGSFMRIFKVSIISSHAGLHAIQLIRYKQLVTCDCNITHENCSPWTWSSSSTMT